MISPFPTPKQAPAGWTYLDYPRADILIQATSQYEAGWRAQPCKKEPWTTAWVDAMPVPGSVLWNVGANVGSYALIAARRGVPTVAVEPSYSSYAALCHNALANKLERLLTPLCVALAEGAGVAPLAYRDLAAGAASHAFGQADADKAAAVLPTLALSLDQLHALGVPAPTHLLIDVDGVEARVLAGGAALLRERAISIMIEVQHDQAESISSMLTSWGYREAERWDHREDLPLAGCFYARYEKG